MATRTSTQEPLNRVTTTAPGDFTRPVKNALLEAKVAQMRRRAETVEDLSFDIPGEDTSALSGDQHSRLRTSEKGREKVTLWHVATGEPSEVLYYQVLSKLSMVGPDGEDVWTLDQTAAASPKRGTMICFLHADNPNRGFYDSIGLGGFVCRKDNLPTAWEARRHGELKHPPQWAAVKEEEERLRREAEQQTSQATLRAMQTLAAGKAEGEAPTLFYCRKDGCGRFFDSDESRAMHEAKPHKEE